jgi:coenzyme F420-reducing hydrogenase alpha subunit
MKNKKQINIDYLARVEGETAINVAINKQTTVKLKIFEPPRFFEGFLVGRKFDEVGDIVSRICGICPVSHMTTAIQAIEKAMDIKISEQTKTIRKILCLSQIAASHIVHLYMLAMPDYYGYSGIIEMQRGFAKQILRLMQMKEVMNDLTGLIGGRALHPVTELPGGFTSIPTEDRFKEILRKLIEIRPLAEEAVKDVSRFKVPDFKSDTEYVSLSSDSDYAVTEGRIVSSKGLDIPVDDYFYTFEESESSYAFAKKTIIKGRSSFMVGALARMNNKFDLLQERTRKLAGEIGFSVPDLNPFHNNLAQSLEVADCIERCIQFIESGNFKDEEFEVNIKEGEGGCATEAPRGLLFHWYRVNHRGVVEKANIVTPTSHNFLNIEKDLKKLAEQNRNRGTNQIRLLCEQLVRAYDPCFSCSVH